MSNFTTSATLETTTHNVMTFNINRTHILETSPHLNWNNREDKVVKIINKVKPDVLMLQELRVLDGCKTNNEFLSLFKEYDFHRAGRNPTKLAMQQATGWNTDKFFASETLTRWLSDTPTIPSDNNPKGWGTVVLFTKLYAHIDGKVCTQYKPFWVINVHYPLAEKDKSDCSFILGGLIDEICGGEDYILAGDFNSFYDLDGKKQMDYLMDNLPSMPVDVTGIIRTSQTQTPCNGTFVGTSLDNFRATFPNLGYLDHIIIPARMVCGIATAHTETCSDIEPPELSDRDSLPSDHLPISTTFSLGFN